MNAWILGSEGLLGSSLQNACTSFVASPRKEVDITDLEALRKFASKHAFTHLFNCAAYTDVDQAEKEQKAAYAVNSLGAENVGLVGKEFGIKVIHISTDYVFDGEKQTPYLETDPPSPVNAYGESKLEGERRLEAVFPGSCIVRTSWMFGGKGKNFLSRTLELIKNQRELRVDHEHLNRGTYCRDLSRVLLEISSHSGIFHFANEGQLSRFEFVRAVCRTAMQWGIPLQCEKILPAGSQDFGPGAPRPPFSVLNTEKIEKVLGRKPRHWNETIPEYLLYAEKISL